MNYSPYFFAGGGGGDVVSVNGEVGVVVLDYADVGAAPLVHTHVAADVTDFDAAALNAVEAPIQTNINDSLENAIFGEIADNIAAAVAAAVSALIGTATAAADTLGEIEALLATKLNLSGGTMTGALTMSSGFSIACVSDTGNVGFDSYVYVGSSTGVTFRARKARGSLASPASVNQNDNISSFNGQGYGGGGFRNAGDFNYQVVAATPSATDMECRWKLFLAPAASITLTEMLRADHATGFSMFGGNVVVDASRHFRARQYTIATLPTAAVAGEAICVTDLGGGHGTLESTGASSAWRRRTPGYQTIATNADATITPLTEAENIRHTGTLTADRTITLSTTRAYVGASFRITRTGAGAFNLSIGGLKNLAQNTWCKVVYDGSAWFLAEYGAL